MNKARVCKFKKCDDPSAIQITLAMKLNGREGRKAGGLLKTVSVTGCDRHAQVVLRRFTSQFEEKAVLRPLSELELRRKRLRNPRVADRELLAQEVQARVITKVEVQENGRCSVYFDGGDEPFTAAEFRRGSATWLAIVEVEAAIARANGFYLEGNDEPDR